MFTKIAKMKYISEEPIINKKEVDNNRIKPAHVTMFGDTFNLYKRIVGIKESGLIT